MKIPAMMVTMVALATAFFVCMAGLLCLCSRTREQTPAMKRRAAVCMAFALVLAVLGALPLLGVRHGMTPQMAMEMEYLEVLRAIPDSPVTDSSPPEDESGQLYVLYRFDCDACQASYGLVEDVLSETGAVPVYLSSRSAPGKDFVQRHRIASVPSMVYVTRGDPSIFFVEPVYPNNRFNESGVRELVGRYLDRE